MQLDMMLVLKRMTRIFKPGMEVYTVYLKVVVLWLKLLGRSFGSDRDWEHGMITLN